MWLLRNLETGYGDGLGNLSPFSDSAPQHGVTTMSNETITALFSAIPMLAVMLTTIWVMLKSQRDSSESQRHVNEAHREMMKLYHDMRKDLH